MWKGKHYGGLARVPILAACIMMTVVSAASEQVRTTTYDGIPLDEPFSVRVRDTILRIPVGYIGPWLTQKERGRISARQPLNLNFWMPERRYVEIGDLSIAGFRPKEPGRGEPLPDASVVRVNDLNLVSSDKLGARSPEKQFQNLTSLAGLSSYSFKNEEFGLVRYWQHDWPHPQPEPFLRYRHVAGSDPQIHLRCTPPHLVTPYYSMCIGYVYIAPDELSFQIWFSGTDLPRWREYVFAVRDLFRTWKTQ